MKTRKHGHGMPHKEVVRFSNRLVTSAQPDNNIVATNQYTKGFIKGWETAAKYFAHELREELRRSENNIMYQRNEED